MDGLYNAAFEVWNTLITVAMNLFITSPTAAGGGSLYSVAHGIYSVLSSISVPIATVFFLIAICRDVVMTPPDQQIRRFLGDALKFGIMIGILANLWDIMGAVMQIADGVTASVIPSASGGTFKITIDSTLQLLIDTAKVLPPAPTYASSGNNLIQFFVNMFEWGHTTLPIYIVNNIFLLIGGLICFVTTVAASFTIISCAFQRIIKPLVIMPFASITVAMGSGSGEASRVMSSYLKTFFGFCLSGAFMVVCIKLGAQLATHMVFGKTGVLTTDIVIMSIQTAAVPLVIAGLIKGVDAIIARFF